MDITERPYNHAAEEVLSALGVIPSDGLSPEEAGKLLKRYGRNRLGEAKTGNSP